MSPPRGRVLVVATTPDYVDALRRLAPGRAVFLTHPRLRAQARETPPPVAEEILADPDDAADCMRLIADHATRYGIAWKGIACYDCNSLAATARIAAAMALPWHSEKAVARCRDKRRAALLWRRAGLDAPQSVRIPDASQAAAFLQRKGGAIVMKPADGTGSEGVFLCQTQADCREAWRILSASNAAASSVVACERVRGVEFSCDFIHNPSGARIVRLARKHLRGAPPFGIAQAYELPPEDRWPLDRAELESLFSRAAAALGLGRALCMVDFIMRDGRAFMLEMAPRPGGDCLPPLVRAACGIDTLSMALRLAGGETCDEPMPAPEASWFGVRFFASQAGRLAQIDEASLRACRGVVETSMNRRVDDAVCLPPQDCDSWILGHAICRSQPGESAPELCRRLERALNTRIESPAVAVAP